MTLWLKYTTLLSKKRLFALIRQQPNFGKSKNALVFVNAIKDFTEKENEIFLQFFCLFVHVRKVHFLPVFPINKVQQTYEMRMSRPFQTWRPVFFNPTTTQWYDFSLSPYLCYRQMWQISDIPRTYNILCNFVCKV